MTQLLLVLLSLLLALAPAPHDAAPSAPLDDDDRAGIEAAIQAYFDGTTYGDPDLVRQAFHPDAQMMFVRDGAYRAMPITDYIARIEPGRTLDRTLHIHQIDASGTAGTAKIELRYHDYRFIDYFALLKIGDDWKIVTKIFQRETLGD